ncbi:MFS transporter [Facklamia sp. P12945]|uniref:MFS transporter n=1 Tax=unclassified Facklamia TaxID=2622293 RepID=UPI003D174076
MKTINYDRRALITSMIASGLDDVNVMFLAFSLSSIIADLNISSTQAGWIGTITNFGMLFGGLVFGVLADRYNKYKVLKWTVAIFSAATALIFFSQSINSLLALRFLAGIGVGGEYGVALAIMAGIVPSNKMGRISSLNGVMGQIGSITSAVLASLIAPVFGWRGLFALGVLPLILVAYMHFMIKEDQITDRGSQKVDRQQAGKISDLFKTPALAHQTIALMVMTSVQIAGYFGMMNWLPTMMQGKLGISLGNSNLWMITTIVGMSIGMLVFGYFLDMFGPRLVYGIFLILSAISVFAFTYVHSALSLLLGGALMGFFVNGMFAGYGAMVTRLYPLQVRAVANNIILNVGRAIGGFSSLIIGMILENYAMRAVMFFLASLYIISFCFMISIKNLKQERYQTIHTNSPALEPAKV